MHADARRANPCSFALRWTARLLVLAALLALVDCGAAQPMTPIGFAACSGDGRTPFRAVSAEGVVYRVRREPNPGAAPLAFWKEALAARMRAAGYTVLAEDTLSDAGTAPGTLLDLVAPRGTRDQGYLVGLFVRDETLVIVEAAGERAALDARRSALLAAIHTSRF